MTVTRLIKPVSVVIQQRDDASVLNDDLRREAVGFVAFSAPITLLAQYSTNTEDRDDRRYGGAGGPVQAVRGKLTFMKQPLRKASITLKPGDRVVSIAGNPVNAYLTERRPSAFVSGTQGTEVWLFADRATERNR